MCLVKSQTFIIAYLLLINSIYVKYVVLASENKTEENFTSAFPIVCTDSGCVEGIAKPGYQTDEYEAFFGIPYAEPPIGDLRFAVS